MEAPDTEELEPSLGDGCRVLSLLYRRRWRHQDEPDRHRERQGALSPRRWCTCIQLL